MNKVMKITDLRDEATCIADYKSISGLSEREAELQYQCVRRALLPQRNRVVFCIDDETLLDLKAEAKTHQKSLGEVIRGRLRIAEKALEDLKAQVEAAKP